MNIRATLTRERADKKKGKRTCVNIDLFGKRGVMLGRLVFREHPSQEGAYVLGEDFFFRSGRLSVHTFREKADTPLEEIVGTMTCLWCDRPATRKKWREIDGTTTSTRECGQCAGLDTGFLLERPARQKRQRGAVRRARQR